MFRICTAWIKEYDFVFQENLLQIIVFFEYYVKMESDQSIQRQATGLIFFSPR